MAGVLKSRETQSDEIVLGLLESVERDGAKSQRRIAAELGIALGLVNAYLKRCIKKGLVKVSSVPAKRYGYYLTPQGFAEKSRLTVEYLSYSFGFFRRAKLDCAETFETARTLRIERVALAGASDLAEIASICSVESSIEIVAVVDRRSNRERFLDYPVVPTFAAIRDQVDGVVVTDLNTTQETIAEAATCFAVEAILVPRLLRARAVEASEVAS